MEIETRNLVINDCVRTDKNQYVVEYIDNIVSRYYLRVMNATWKTFLHCFEKTRNGYLYSHSCTSVQIIPVICGSFAGKIFYESGFYFNDAHRGEKIYKAPVVWYYPLMVVR